MAVVVGIGTPSEPGVSGESNSGFAGVRGTNTADGVGVRGFAKTNAGVRGDSESGPGVSGFGNGSFAGVRGENTADGVGVRGFAKNGDGVRGDSEGGGAGVRGFSKNPDHVGVVGENNAGGFAGLFVGNVEIRGFLRVSQDIFLQNADCAEDFDIACLEEVEPGTVMVIDSEGALKPSNQAYDKRVAGVISGAGNYKPGLILDKQQDSSSNRMPIALLGKVYCKVDANYGVIEVGDLLTTSPTPGHAMKTNDPLKAFGAVIGKALRPLESGQGLIPILIALQ
jgi:hypothetical protein